MSSMGQVEIMSIGGQKLLTFTILFVGGLHSLPRFRLCTQSSLKNVWG